MREIGGYRLVALLGEDGMGQAHLARAGSGRLVALRTVHARLAADPRFRERLRREAAAARSVDGPYTAQVLAADPDAEPPWLAAEYCAGPSLSEAVSALGPLDEGQLAALGALLAQALTALHTARLVHRDLKPANVIVTRDGPKVIDFGIAKGIGEGESTTGGGKVGSPGFIAPEQLAGDAESGPPADVFALGGLLALCATGRNPFGAGSAPKVLHRTLHDEPDLDGVPGTDWREFLGRCLARDPADRPTVAEALAWCAARGTPEPWWEREPVTGLIHQHEEATAELVAAAPEEPAPAPEEPAPEEPAPEEPAATPPTTRRRFLLWSASGAVAAAGISTAVALDEGGDTDTSGTVAHARTASWPRGRTVWTRELGDVRHGGSLLRHGDALYVHDTARLTRLDPATGAVRWQRDAHGVTQVVPHGKDLVHIVRTDHLGAPTLAALDATTGDLRWETRDAAPDGLRPADTSLSPEPDGGHGLLALGDRVACLVTYESYGTEGARGTARPRPWRAYGYDVLTGAPLWYHEGTAAAVTALRHAGGRFAVATSTRAQSDTPELLKARAQDPLHVLRATDGREETAIEGGALRPDAHPGAVGTGYFAAGEAVSAVDLTTRTTLWSRGVTGSVSVTPTACGDLVHAGSRTELSALDATTGRTRWLRTDVARITAAGSTPPLLADGRLYATGPEPGTGRLALDGPNWGLHTLDPTTGKLLWAAPFEDHGDPYGAAGDGLVHIYTGTTLTTFQAPEATA
ncbi:PQQ-binding-like beta-propeller repeat protein [Streptomyces sp. NPDC048696]|uniref:protein kinase domain-containing protein n=1 Tax=Streptomyces sp. NPDC048696 TaxID=3365585 RepID=UPI003724735B